MRNIQFDIKSKNKKIKNKKKTKKKKKIYNNNNNTGFTYKQYIFTQRQIRIKTKNIYIILFNIPSLHC